MMRRTANERRAKRRAVAVWAARYRIDPSEPWYSCRVLDVSMAGAGLELLGPLPPKGSPLILELEQQDLSIREERRSRVDDVGLADLVLERREAVGAELQAVVRNAVSTTDGFRVGVEFEPLTPLERTVLT